MITEWGIKRLKRYCREPIENIKGYREAVEGDGRYDCHHINELTFTMNELKKMNMYYNRPASELIILTHSQHLNWHIKWNGNGKWKGDNAGPATMYRRALKLYKSGQISEEEFQPFRDKWQDYLRLRRK